MAAVRSSRFRAVLVAAAAALAVPTAGLVAQQPATPQPEVGPKVGEMAPDFSVPAATRYGLLREQVKLSSLRGNTVVLAFFFQARTKG
jgi:hypothetical protein